MGRVLSGILLLLLTVAAPLAFAQEKGAVREGFSADALKGQKILLFRPSVWVGEQSTGGMPEPRSEWTLQARELLEAELRLRQADFSNDLINEPDAIGPDADVIAGHKALFNSVAHSVMTYQFFVGNRLPTRKNKAFDWTLGEGTKRMLS